MQSRRGDRTKVNLKQRQWAWPREKARLGQQLAAAGGLWPKAHSHASPLSGPARGQVLLASGAGPLLDSAHPSPWRSLRFSLPFPFTHVHELIHARVCSTDTCPRCQGSAGQGHVCCASARVPATECGACQQQGRVPRSRTSFAEARSTGRAGRDTAAAHATHAQLLSLAAGFPANPGAGLHAPDLALVSTFTRRFPNLAAQPPVSSNSRWLC